MATHVSVPSQHLCWRHIVKSKPVLFMMHVAARGQLQGLVTVPFTISIITSKNKMTGFCLFVLGCWKIGLRILSIQACYPSILSDFSLCKRLVCSKSRNYIKILLRKAVLLCMFCVLLPDIGFFSGCCHKHWHPLTLFLTALMLVKAISWFIASTFTLRPCEAGALGSFLWVCSLHSGFARSRVIFLELLALLILSLWAEISNKDL